MDLGRAFGFVTEDEQWLNVILIGGLLMIIPIVGQIALIGFMLETARNVAQGNPRPLPRWNNFGDKFMMGLYGLVISIFYALPIVLLAFIMVCITLSGAAAATESEAAGGLFAVLATCLIPLMILFGLVIQPVLLAAQARYVQTNSLSESLRVGEVIRMVRSELGVWIVLWLVYILCSFVGSLGGIALGIGALFTMVYSQAVFGHAMGQTIVRTGSAPGYGAGTPPPTYQ